MHCCKRNEEGSRAIKFHFTEQAMHRWNVANGTRIRFLCVNLFVNCLIIELSNLGNTSITGNLMLGVREKTDPRFALCKLTYIWSWASSLCNTVENYIQVVRLGFKHRVKKVNVYIPLQLFIDVYSLFKMCCYRSQVVLWPIDFFILRNEMKANKVWAYNII